MGKLSYIYPITATERLSITKKHNMTQTNTIRVSYTRATMDSTDIYNYLKRLARKTSNDKLDCLAEAMISSYGDNYDIETKDVKTLCVATGYMTGMDYREMECHVTTSLSVVPVTEVAA